MRNIKRVLSLVLTMVMLLGMVMIPTGAAGSFTDEEMIVNKEAVQITSGLGLFAGSDGKFNPKGLVTRAQMATIIVKMLRGSDFNADAFKGVGVNPFPDTAAFEGGWAEGYINACYQMGVVAGYGDGTFKPGNVLTTAEAITMIINALGVDPGPGEWPITYMAKAEEMKLYGDLAVKPATDSPLNRDQLAVLAWEGLQYSPKGQSGWRIADYDMVFENYADALKANGGSASGISEAVGEDTLASKVYEIKTATGWITENQATGEKATILTHADGSEEKYGVETGVDMLGHYVTVYYKEKYTSDKQPGQVYTIVDESTVVTVTEAISSNKDYKAAFGTSYKLASEMLNFDSNYVHENDDQYDADAQKLTSDNYTAGSKAPTGTYIIYEGQIVSYIKPATVYASYIVDISTAEGKESVWINGANGDAAIPNTEGDDQITEYAGMAIGDYVTYIKVNGVYVLSPLTKIVGKIQKHSTTKVNNDVYNTITVNGTVYTSFEKKDDYSHNNLPSDVTNDLSSIVSTQNYVLYVTDAGQYVGFEATDDASVADTVYLLGAIQTKSANNYGEWVMENKGRGIDMDGKEVLVLLGKQPLTGKDGELTGTPMGVMDTEIATNFYTVKDSSDPDLKKEGIKELASYDTAYSFEKPTFYTTNAIKNATFTGAGSMIGRDNMAIYGTADTRFIYLDGELTDDEPLTASVVMEKITARSLNTVYDLLVTRDPSGSRNNLNVMIIREASETTENIYVSQAQLDNSSNVPEGTAYEVYGAIDGAVKEVVLAEGSFSGPGFYSVATNEEGETRITASNITADAVIEAKFFSNVGFNGIMPNGLVRAIAIDAEGKEVDVGTVTGGANVKVVDVRSEEQIEADGVPEITSAAQLTTLRENNPTVVVIANLSTAKSGNYQQSKVLFISGAVRNSSGLNSVVYSAEGLQENGEERTRVFFVSGTGKRLGDPMYVSYDKAIGGTEPGFYRHTVNADGDLIMQYMTPGSVTGSNFTNVLGMHTAIAYIDEEAKFFVPMDIEDDCDDCTGANEALRDVEIKVTDNTFYFNQMTGQEMTFEELVEMVGEDDTAAINYYCTGTGLNDDSAEMVVVYAEGVEKPYYVVNVQDCPDHAGETPLVVTGDTTLTTGTYVLTDAIEAEGLITIDGDVTLCLHDYRLSAPSTTGAFITVGDGATLNICGGAEGLGTIFGGKTTATRCIYLKGGTLNLTSGTISGFKVDTAAVAAAIHMDGGTFNMSGGKITGNVGRRNATVYCDGDGVINLSGGSIEKNTVNAYTSGGTVGAGVTVRQGTLNISGTATIQYNTVSDSGRHNYGIQVAAGIASSSARGTVVMTGGEINGNEGEANTVGINNGSFELNGGTINGTVSTRGYGSGENTFTLKKGTIDGNVVIGNDAKGKPATCYLVIEDGNVTGTIEKNDASTITISGGTFNYEITETSWLKPGYTCQQDGAVWKVVSGT